MQGIIVEKYVVLQKRVLILILMYILILIVFIESRYLRRSVSSFTLHLFFNNSIHYARLLLLSFLPALILLFHEYHLLIVFFPIIIIIYFQGSSIVNLFIKLLLREMMTMVFAAHYPVVRVLLLFPP